MGGLFFLVFFFFLGDLKWFQMLLGMTNRLRISTAASLTDEHLCNSFDKPGECKSNPTLASRRKAVERLMHFLLT